MKNERQNDLFSELKRKVPKRNREDLAVALNGASDVQLGQLRSFKRAQYTQSFHCKVAWLACIIAAVILILDCLVYSLLLPYQTQMADYARTNSERFSTYYLEAAEYGKTGELIVEGFYYADWESYLKAEYREYNENATNKANYEQSLNAAYSDYTKKLAAYQTARSFLSNKYNNYTYPTYWLATEEEPQDSAEKTKYDNLKKSYEEKIAIYQNYESTIDVLEQEYLTAAQNCVNLVTTYPEMATENISLRTKISEAITQADKAKIAGLSVAGAVVSGGLLSAYQNCVADYDNDLSTFEAYYKSASSVSGVVEANKKKISEEEATLASVKSSYGLFLQEPLTYLNDLVTLYKPYADSEKKLDALVKEYETATKHYEAAKGTADETAKYQEYLTAKQAYDTNYESYNSEMQTNLSNYNNSISRKILSYFSLGDYAEVVTSCEEAKLAYEEVKGTDEETEKYKIYQEYLQQVEKLEARAQNVPTYIGWTYDDYYAAQNAYEESEAAYNAAKKAADEKEAGGTLTEAEKLALEKQKEELDKMPAVEYVVCVNGVSAYENYVASSEDSIQSLKMQNNYTLVFKENSENSTVSEKYYNLEFIASQLQIYYNLTLPIMEGTKTDISDIIAEELPETIPASYLTDNSHSDMHDKIMEKGGINAYFEGLTAYLNNAEKYALSANILAEFNLKTLDRTALKNLSKQFASDLDGFSAQLKGLSTVSDSLTDIAKSYKLSSDKFAMIFLIYNSVLIAIAFFYFVGELLIVRDERRVANYTEIKNILNN